MRFAVVVAGPVVCATIGLCAPASADAFDFLFGARPSQGAWCARTNTGAGRIDEDCIFDSFEACRRTVIGGNRGFCTQNPAFTGNPQQPPRKKRRVHSQ